MSDRPDRDYESRITVDLDGDKYTHGQFDLKATQIWHNLQDSADHVDVHVSSSGLGMHFVAWFEQDLQFAEEVALRRASGDDPRRIWMDCQRWLNGLYTDVLFESKDTRRFDKERGFATVYEALAFINEYRSDDHERVKSVAQDGHRGDPELARRADL
ncbi:putative protein 30 [Haloarcula hispanica icosahedral virus 2]|uniref:Uncharacterized protein n=1 Tax=Haloarcula hispanica icosahedral virus 2 TaxID=1154689 RepID=H9AZY6_9VIRU|nr:putative protein 30 [Haloarcula hispanica icosahedral virus 2]AFD02311.1 putative protein 30 [Haloarcula hispanica icosahedral virus 2]